MNAKELESARSWIKSELDRCIGFWLEHGMDGRYGGVYTCLDRAGNIFSTDKSVWMQGRCAWTFSNLCRLYGARQEWLDAARSCLEFARKHCINHGAGGRMYFTVTADGRPLRQRRYCFSESFYALGCAEYYGVTGEQEYLDEARRAYDLVYGLNHGAPDPTGLGPKTIPETRSGRALANPMILMNLASVMGRTDAGRAEMYREHARQCARDIFAYHFKPELHCTLETVAPDGSVFVDVTEGRVVNPGHDIECSWFLMELANAVGDRALHEKARQMIRFALDGGWDEEYGGLLYFIDCKGLPPESYEHDMKLWWPHNEALIASLMAFRDTGDEEWLTVFNRVLDYCRTYFADPAYGEWYGYLRRDGKPTQPPCKGSTFKGPFHVPRSLMMADVLLGEILSNK